MKPTNANLIRLAGVAAMISGVLYVLTQLTHPANESASVTSDMWALAHTISLGFSAFGMIGLIGIYAKQSREAGWLGLIGFIMFFFALALTAAFVFFEAFFLPLLVTAAPDFVHEFFLIFEDASSLQLLTALNGVAGIMYMGGGTLFGIMTIRAGVFPRMAGILFTLGTAGALTSLISESVGRMSTVVLSMGLIWLGFALLTEWYRLTPQPAPALKVAA